ncbi:MAG: hypothetical protein PHQ12_08210 [Chthoniobacteraceae bacterium]|nr:hypothetical protein [Chthoniobacteraceae bacterium]
MDDSSKWFLMKQADGTVFGPMPFSQLHQWAVDACVSPLDKVSTDQTSWVKAPMIPELHMDYLVEVDAENYYGPTTLGAVREFLMNGEITETTILTNCRTGEQQPLAGLEQVFQAPEKTASPIIRVSARENLQSRIRELEEALLQERLLRKTADELRAKAEARIAELEELLGIGEEG